MRRDHRPKTARIRVLALLALAAAVTAGCKAPADATPAAPQDPTIISTGPGSATVNTAKFTIGVKFADTVQTYMHVATDWTKRCEVDPAEPIQANRDLLCYLDAAELDLYFQKFTIVGNAPSSMCSYVLLKPYWFYQFPPGIGSTSVEYDVDAAGHVYNMIDHANATSRLKTVSKGTAVACRYDYTSDSPPGPNCCSGSYNALVHFHDSNGGVTTNTTSADWGGKWGNCAAGPGTLGQFARDLDQNRPVETIYWSNDASQTASIDVPSPSMQRYASMVYSSNYLADPIGGLPQALKPTLSDGAHPEYGPTPGYPFYEWQCLDIAWELQARVRVMIRKWNLASELAKQAAGNPDTIGAEPNYPDQPIEDRFDWADFGEYVTAHGGGEVYPSTSL